MPYKRKPNRPCVVCGEFFPPRASAKTCSDECSAERFKAMQREYARKHAEEIAARHQAWRSDNLDRERANGRQRYADNHARYAKSQRELKRRVRGTDPADYVENRDPATVKERERERWRRGQAARRERLREASP